MTRTGTTTRLWVWYQKMTNAKITNPDQAWSAIRKTSFLRSDSLVGRVSPIAATGEAQEEEVVVDEM